MTGRHLTPAWLPQELWCSVWEELPFESRVAITRTCRLWRSVALSCPSLWSDIAFFTAIQSNSIGSLVLPPRLGWPLISYRDGTTNIGSAQDILSRSRDLPLFLTLDIVPCFVSLSVLRRLAADLKQATHRLVRLQIRSGDLDAVRTFLSQFGNLSALRSLSLEQTKNEEYRPQVVALRSNLVLPNIRTLHLDAAYSFHSGSLSLTSVRTFSLSLHSDPHAEVHRALQAAPSLRLLLIDFAELRWTSKPTEDPALVRQLAARIPSVTLVSVPDRCTAWALAAFYDPARPRLALERCWCSFNTEYRSIFGDLGQDIRLRVVTARDRRVVITGTDTRGVLRCIDSVQDADFAPLFAPNYLNRDNFIELSVCTSLLPRLGGTFENVMTLVLFVDDLTFLHYHPRPPLPRFPALQTLTLLAGLDGVDLYAEDVFDVVHALSVPLPLRSINIDHRIFLPDPDERSALSGCSQTRVGARRRSPVPSPKPHCQTSSCATYSLAQSH